MLDHPEVVKKRWEQNHRHTWPNPRQHRLSISDKLGSADVGMNGRLATTTLSGLDREDSAVDSVVDSAVDSVVDAAVAALF